MCSGPRSHHTQSALTAVSLSSALQTPFNSHFILANKTLLGWLDHFIFPIIWEMHLDKGTFIELSFITQVFLPKKKF